MVKIETPYDAQLEAAKTENMRGWLDHYQSLQRGYRECWAARDALAREQSRLTGQLVEAVKDVLKHLEELCDAWQRGTLSEHDGKGGTRSNRNADCLHQLKDALAAVEAQEKP